MKCYKSKNNNKRNEKHCASREESFSNTSVNSKKKTKRCMGIATILFLLIVAAGVVFVIPEIFESKQARNQAQETVNAFLDRYHACDPAASELLAGTEDIAMSYEGIPSSFAEKLRYEIISCRKDSDDLYIVEIQATTMDFEKLFTVSAEETAENYGEDNVTDYLLDVIQQKITDDACETKTISAQVPVLKIDGEYKIQMNGSFANALSGGMNDYLESLAGGE